MIPCDTKACDLAPLLADALRGGQAVRFRAEGRSMRPFIQAGDIVKVKVLEVDVARKRIALTRRLDDTPAPREARQDARRDGGAAGRDGRMRGGGARNARPGGGSGPKPSAAPANNALAEAFARAKRS